MERIIFPKSQYHTFTYTFSFTQINTSLSPQTDTRSTFLFLQNQKSDLLLLSLQKSETRSIQPFSSLLIHQTLCNIYNQKKNRGYDKERMLNHNHKKLIHCFSFSPSQDESRQGNPCTPRRSKFCF